MRVVFVIIFSGTRPRVHKETENEDQAQDQTYKLQLLDTKSCKFDEKDQDQI